MARLSAPELGPRGSPVPRWIRSRDNATLRLCRRLCREPSAYREFGKVWVEGEHLCGAMLRRGIRPLAALMSQTAWESAGPLRALAAQAAELLLIPDLLFAQVSALPSPAGLAFLAELPPSGGPALEAAAVVLDRVQDAGNVGSILRTASAFGVRQVWALSGTASLWSPKVLRSGMGAHFALRLFEGLQIEDFEQSRLPWVAADARAGRPLPEVELPNPCVWVFGHEGQGLSAQVASRCGLRIRIPQPGGEESLNVAAAAAICLYASSVQRKPLARSPRTGR